MAISVSVEHVSKRYRLGLIGVGTLQADLGRAWARLRGRPDPFEKIGLAERRSRIGTFNALNDVSFSIREGEVVGIIGRNGAGKSTLLKILSQVTAPTDGRVTLRGRLGSLLEVGTGFHPDLTGRENIFLNGAIMGMTRREIKQKYDEIVAFSECSDFIDTPVKRYSSGMFVRLAFAVAAHLEPDILVVDEVLAVGDAAFQRKCLGKMGEASRGGRTVLFVSHSMAAVSALCSRGVLLRHGRVAVDGTTREAVDAYMADQPSTPNSADDLANAQRRGTGRARFVGARFFPIGSDGTPCAAIAPGVDVAVEIDIEANSDVTDANVGFTVLDRNGYRVMDVHSAAEGRFLSLKRGERATSRFHLRDMRLGPGSYSVDLWMGRGELESIDHVESVLRWTVHEEADVKHTEVFPGVYRCRFTYAQSALS